MHFAINVLSLVFVAISYEWESESTLKVFPILLPINIGVLLAFLYFYAADVRQEQGEVRYSSFIEEPTRDLHRKVFVNEGKYLFYFNWGANVFSKGGDDGE